MKIKDTKEKRTTAQPLNENTTETGKEPMQCSAYYNEVSKNCLNQGWRRGYALVKFACKAPERCLQRPAHTHNLLLLQLTNQNLNDTDAFGIVIKGRPWWRPSMMRSRGHGWTAMGSRNWTIRQARTVTGGSPGRPMGVVRVMSMGRGTLIFRNVGDLHSTMEQLIMFIQCLLNFQHVFHQCSSPLMIALNDLICQINPLQQDLHTTLMCFLGAVCAGSMLVASTNEVGSSLWGVPTDQLHAVTAPLRSGGGYLTLKLPGHQQRWPRTHLAEPQRHFQLEAQPEGPQAADCLPGTDQTQMEYLQW